MIHFFQLSAEGCRAYVAFDSDRRIAHLLESEESAIALAEAAHTVMESARERIARFCPIATPTVRWLIYDRRGCVFECRERERSPLELADRDLYAPFVKKLKLRRASLDLEVGSS